MIAHDVRVWNTFLLYRFPLIVYPVNGFAVTCQHFWRINEREEGETDRPSVHAD